MEWDINDKQALLINDKQACWALQTFGSFGLSNVRWFKDRRFYVLLLTYEPFNVRLRVGDEIAIQCDRGSYQSHFRPAMDAFGEYWG